MSLPVVILLVGTPLLTPPPAPPALPRDPVVDEVPLAPAIPEAGADEVIGPAAGAPTVDLAGAVALSLENNFAILGTVDSVTSSRLGENVARAQFYPKLLPSYGRSGDDTSIAMSASQKLPFTGGSVAASATFRSAIDDAVPLPHRSDLQLSLTQPLLRGFGPNAAHYDLRNQRRARERAERDLELERQRLAVRVAGAFYEIVRQRQLLGVAQQSLHRTEALLEASQARLRVGLVSKLDVFRAELQAAQARESAVRAETALQGALEQFRALLGMSPAEALEPQAVTLAEEIPTDTLEPVEVLVERARLNRRDLQETRDQVDDARRTVSLARQNLLPQLDLNVSLSRFGLGTSFGGAWDAGERRVNVFLSSSYPLERTGDVTQKAMAELAMSASNRHLRQRELDLEAEVRGAVRELHRLRKSIELQKTAVDVAEQQHRLASLRYQRGLASNFDVVDAEGSLVVARSALVGLLTSYRVARIDLLRVTGELDVEKEFAR
ncbi:MAG TPA: TolC family protein [Vicinamibacteria bacterium]|nr:TolC family protein [Vicinamibacteria bacterium]